VWFSRTRRSLAGFGLGVLWSALVFAAAVAATLVPEVAIDWLGL
jgi:hypothetical protein